jgi:hypothetical protein
MPVRDEPATWPTPWLFFCGCFLIGIWSMPSLVLAAEEAAANQSATDNQPATDAIAATEEFFEKEIRPLLVSRCFTCHGRQADVQGGLSLASRQAILSGGESGPAARPGHADQSLIIQAIRREGLEMPPKEKLPDDEIAKLQRWVAAGLYWPGADEASLKPASSGKFQISADDRRFWSFRPIVDPAIPTVRNAAWPLTPVDAFVLAELEKKKFAPNDLAEPRSLLRRATYDLTGLPPTSEEIREFLADPSPTAFDTAIDRLLASTAYGERWGRHWLDVVRYADTAGDGSDYPVPQAYKYRNYVIDAFNADLPYDQFLREQIAGDILAAESPDSRYAERIIATGYIAVTKRFGYNTNKVFHHLDIADTLDTLGRSILGLSIGCARCHDHKYDPISTADYYALYGIFDSSRYSFPGGEEHKRPADLIPLVPPAEAARLDAAYAAALNEFDERIKAATEQKALLATSIEAGTKASQPETELAALRAQLATAEKLLADLHAAKAARAAQKPYEVAYGVREGEPIDAKVQHRGEPDKLGDEVPRRFLELLGGDLVPAGSRGSGRRELAQWLTRPGNPLTARVMVNRIWQQHFGRGIVNSPSDFGLRGEAPSHPELLDYLATRFVESGWSIKAMHRLMMRSRVYRLSSAARPEMMTADPRNVWHWQFSRRRLSAEELRDTMLVLSGNLDRSPAGPHPFPPVEKWNFSIHYPFFARYDSNRRSVYLMTQRSRKHPYLSLFDAADNNISTAQRLPTTTPTQALYLMNDPFVHEQSTGLAKRLLAAAEPTRIALAYELTAGQLPSAEETAWTESFLAEYAQRAAALGQSGEQQTVSAWSALGRVLLTRNASMYVD